LENNILSFKHSCYSGDLIYALAGIKAICENNSQQAVIYQWLDKKAFLYEGAQHPYGGSMMNEYAFDMLKPLLEAQPYIKSFEKWNGENVHIDMDVLRQVKNHMPYGNIVTWMAMVYAEMTPKYWEPWLSVKHKHIIRHSSIIINRTSRYHNQWIDYFFLKEYQDRLLFVGNPDEHSAFQTDWGLEMPLIKVRDFLELARVISNCSLFIGNQSMCFAIAEALKTPRILEVCDMAPNVHPAGDGGYYARNPDTFKFLVEKLLK
jgi:hypothetical protein